MDSKRQLFYMVTVHCALYFCETYSALSYPLDELAKELELDEKEVNISSPDELLLKPLLQKHLAWDGWDDPDEIPVLLAALGARPWQVENVAPAIVASARRAKKQTPKL